MCNPIYFYMYVSELKFQIFQNFVFLTCKLFQSNVLASPSIRIWIFSSEFSNFFFFSVENNEVNKFLHSFCRGVSAKLGSMLWFQKYIREKIAQNWQIWLQIHQLRHKNAHNIVFQENGPFFPHRKVIKVIEISDQNTDPSQLIPCQREKNSSVGVCAVNPYYESLR
jgi:hypothetical protein